MKWKLKWIAVLGLGVAVGISSTFFVAPYDVLTFQETKTQWRSSDAWLLDRYGEPLSRIRIDKERRRGDWTALAEASPALVGAVLAAEDRRFFSHSGVDWLAFGGLRGGSTITMQLAAALHPELERGGRRTLLDKWRQMRQALAMERTWSKDEILEAWLNLTPFRGELEGVDAASRALFGKRPAGLDRVESALLAALVRSPNAAASRVAARACALLGSDERGCSEVRGFATALQGRRLVKPLDGDAPHLARRMLTFPGQRRLSSLDARVQRFAAQTLERHLLELEGRNVADGAVLVLDNATGEPLAWVGSSGDLSDSPEIDGVLARRQPGSTLKPFLYALAIERRLLTAASLLDDTPAAVTTPAGLYVPQNYDHTFRGRVSLRTALASSLNVPAVRTLALVGYEPFHERLRALGFASLEKEADYYGYSLALGGSEVTLLELARAYRLLARREGFDPRAAWIVGNILSDSAARAATFGLASPLATRYPSSVKTGTSTDMRDNWAVGFTERYTVGVWVGNFSGEPMHDVSGVSGAAPIWRDVMDFLQEELAPVFPSTPEGVVKVKVHYTENLEPARDEWFIAGTETTRVVPVEAPARRPRIVAPANGAVLALDPDIPAANQHVRVEVVNAAQARVVLEDGAPVPSLWQPAPGRHVLRLVDASGTEFDRVQVTVRGVRSAWQAGKAPRM